MPTDTVLKTSETLLIDAVRRRNFADLATCLAPDAQLRALIPPGLVELHTAEEIAARFERWFGGPDHFEVVDAAAGTIGARGYARWRIVMWPADRPADARTAEQHVYLRGTGLIESIDLLCSGFHAEPRVA